MWRALFLAIGIYLCLLGVECLVVDKVVMKAAEGGGGAISDITPAEWAPWSFLSAGAVTILYSFTIPRRVKT